MGRNPEDSFFLIGISHKTAPVEIRERFSFDTGQVCVLLSEIHRKTGISECVALSTCNRTEIYAVLGDDPTAPEHVRACLSEASGVGDELREYFYTLEGATVVQHLFRVASGLDSMVLGEPQILGQVKTAYSIASDCQTTGPAINRLFHHAFRTGKTIRNQTAVGAGTVSVSLAAVELAGQVVGGLEGKTVLLAGTGKIGELCARRLTEAGVRTIFIANRTPERANDLAARLAGVAVPFDSLHDLCAEADIVITSVGSREPIIREARLRPVLDRRGGTPLFLIDLGVPRNVDPAVAGLPCVHVSNIDDLEGVTGENRDRRRTEAEKAEEIVRREVEDFCCRLSEREVAPVIREMHDRCEAVRIRELDRVRGRLNDETFELLDLVTRRIVRKILHNPTVAVRSSESGDIRQRLLESVQELFMGKESSVENRSESRSQP